MIIILLIAITAFYTWRYANDEIDPDWAMFNLAGFTGSWYGRDFVDCKSPAIHLWYWTIAKVVGADVVKVKIVHYALIGAMSIPIYLVSGNWMIAVAYLILVNSGWLFAFHGNVGQQPVAFLTLALVVGNPWISFALWIAALFFEPKLIVSFGLWLLLNLMFDQMVAVGFLFSFSVLILYMLRNTDVVGWLIEANLEIPAAMQRMRKKLWKSLLTANYLAPVYLYILPWLWIGFVSRLDNIYWIPALAYLGFIYLGIAVRPNHFLILGAWIAASGVPAVLLVLMAIGELVSSNFFINVWQRFYPGLHELNVMAKQVGLYLKDKAGTVWVNDLHTGIYIHSRKPVPYGMAAQIEIREVAKHRREKMVELWKKEPADWVVNGPEPLFEFLGNGYMLTARAGKYTVWKRIR